MQGNPFTIKTKKKDTYISALLVLHGVGQADLARKIGVSKSFFNMVIKGKRGGGPKKGPLADKVRAAVADALGMTVAELWPEKKEGEK